MPSGGSAIGARPSFAVRAMQNGPAIGCIHQTALRRRSHSMKFLKVAVMAACAFAFGNAYAFHSGGVAECEGCHSMHNSFEGAANVTGMAQYASGPFLLKAQDQSGACLNCHTGPTLSSYHVDTDTVVDSTGLPSNMTPGGDFSWLKIDGVYNVRGTTYTDHGERRGHNIIAVDFGFAQDSKLATSPGGNYPADQLHCSSCHDPHGRYRRFADGSIAKTGLPIRNSGSYNNSLDPITDIYAVGVYRILGGTGYVPKSLEDAGLGALAFGAQAPHAVTASAYNRAETSQQTQTFTAYGQGMSEWCGNCHNAMVMNGYTSGMAGLRHPAGNGAQLTAAIATNYNAYVRSGIMTNTDVNAAYSSLAPFEVGTNDYSVLKARAHQTGAVNRSASTSNNVACVSCHRVHASGFESMLRFFYLNEFMTIGDNAGVASYETANPMVNGARSHGLSPVQQQRAYYERPASMFGPWARMQCNKCHAKD
jgi:hypothetical protein